MRSSCVNADLIRSSVFTVGQRIALSRFDLCGICISYQNAAETVSNGLAQFLKSKGVLVSTLPSPNAVEVQVLGEAYSDQV
jgi:hypothetical protein